MKKIQVILRWSWMRSRRSKTIVICTGVLILTFLPLIISSNSCLGVFDDTTGVIGDTIGGITAPFIGLLSAILVYLALKAQIDANTVQIAANRQLRKKDEQDEIRKTFDDIFNKIKNHYKDFIFYDDNASKAYRFMTKRIDEILDGLINVKITGKTHEYYYPPEGEHEIFVKDIRAGLTGEIRYIDTKLRYLKLLLGLILHYCKYLDTHIEYELKWSSHFITYTKILMADIVVFYDDNIKWKDSISERSASILVEKVRTLEGYELYSIPVIADYYLQIEQYTEKYKYLI